MREEPGTYWSGRQRGGKPGDRRAGVVWHTQGSGKSFSKKGAVPHIHISKKVMALPERHPQLNRAATISCSLCLAALREDLGWRRRRIRA